MAATTFDNTSRFDIGYWAGNWTNVTNYIPSPKDLALAGPRMFMKLGSLFAVPEAVDGIFGGIGQRVIPEATPHNLVNAATTAAAAIGGVNDALPGAGQLPIDVDDQVAGLTSRFTIEGARGLGSVFSYATSKWALCCIVMAVILNRTHIYASTRRNLSLPWKVRFAIRILPIALLAVQARWLLQSIQCQTSPEFSVLRWGNASKSSELMFTQNGGLLHTFSSTLLLGASDKDSCLAVHMIPPDDDDDDVVDEVESVSSSKPLIPDLSGSLSLLWPLFKTFCASQFIETLSCAVQGRPVATETGMTLFEHSLAFAEADSAIGAQLGWGTFGGTKPITRPSERSTDSKDGRYIAITRSMIMKRVNTTPEVLLVAFLSAMNHLTSQILGIFNLQGRLRLVNTGFWGLAFMSFLVWSISTFSLDDLQNQEVQ